MSKVTKQNRSFLTFLLETQSSVQKKLLLQNITPPQLKALTEIIYNLLHSDITLSKDKLTKLKKYKSALRSLADKSVSVKQKKNILQRSIPAITLVLQFVSPLLKSLS